MIKKELRPYQTDAINSVGRELLTNKVDKQLLVLATGTGKTFLACNIAKKKVFNRILWLTHVEELIVQSANSLANEFFSEDEEMLDYIKKIDENEGILNHYNNMQGEEDLFSSQLSTKLKQMIGIVKQKRMDIDSKIVVASVQTIHRRLDRIDPDHFDLVIADEAHLFGAKSFVKCLDYFKPKLRLGLTATPSRADNFGLGNIFDKVSYQYDIVNGIEDNYLCEINAVQVKTDLSLDSVRTTAGELNSKDLRVVDCPERNNLIVDKYKEYADGRQAIIFCVDVQHVLNLNEVFKNRGLNADFVVGDKELCPNRKERIDKFKRGETQILINCMILVAGFDHPDTGCLIMACPTKSETKWKQCVGRGTRLKSQEFVDKFKQDLILLDIVDTTSRHNLINSYELDKGKPIEERAFISKAKKDKLIEAREKRELKEQLRKKDREVNLLEIPKVKKVNMNSDSMKRPATAKQLEWLKGLGYDITDVSYTMGMVQELVGNLPATEKQKSALKKWRYNVPETLTRAQAQAAFAEIQEKNGESESSKKYHEQRKRNLPFNNL